MCVSPPLFSVLECHRAADADAAAAPRESCAVKAVDLSARTPTPGASQGAGVVSGEWETGTGGDGGWREAGLPRRAERVAAEVSALRRLEGCTAATRTLFPALLDFFIVSQAGGAGGAHSSTSWLHVSSFCGIRWLFNGISVTVRLRLR